MAADETGRREPARPRRRLPTRRHGRELQAANAANDPLPRVAAQVQDQVADAVERRCGAVPDLVVGQLSQAMQRFLLRIRADDQHAVAGPHRPILAFNFHARFGGDFVEVMSAVGGFLNVLLFHFLR